MGSIFSETCKDLIQGMLAYDENERLNLQEIADHEWFIVTNMKGSSDEVKQEYKEKRTRKTRKTRGSLISSDESNIEL